MKPTFCCCVDRRFTFIHTNHTPMKPTLCCCIDRRFYTRQGYKVLRSDIPG